MNDSLTDTIAAKSDQLNSDDLVGGPITVTVQDVVRNNSKDQPVSIIIGGDRQPYKPNLTMRRMLIAGWGDRGKSWIGKSITLFRNPHVKWGGKCVGGIQVSHMSDIESDFELSLSVARGKKAVFTVKKLVVGNAPTPTEKTDIDQQWIDYCSIDLSNLDEIKDPVYRDKIKSMIDAQV